MRSRLLGALAVLWLAPVPVMSQQRPPATGTPPVRDTRTLERVMAVVDERPVLLSDVRVLALVRGLTLSAALEALIDERLMYAEASRLSEAQVSAAEETAALDALYERRPALRGDVGEADLRRLLHRQLAILKYVEFRFRPQVRVSDEQVRNEWEAEEVGRPSGLALEDAEPQIRQRLERRALDEKVESWVSELRSRAEIRVLEPAPALSVSPLRTPSATAPARAEP